MSAMMTATQVAPELPTTAPPAPPAGKRWLVGPAFDLLFLANITWPIIALLVFVAGLNSTVHFQLGFWHQYLLATAHRWITLVIVFADRDRLEERPRAFLGIALFFSILVLVAYGYDRQDYRGVLFLIALDIVWNAWHFAAQHSGIARIYARVAKPGPSSSALLEKTVFRVFVLGVIFELLSTADPTPNLEWIKPIALTIRAYGPWLLLLPGFLMARELWNYRPENLGRVLYMGSILSVYSCLLLASHYFIPSLMVGFGLAINFIHAVEYLAIVSWATKKRHARAGEGIWAYVVPRWTASLVIFMLALCGSMLLLARHEYLIFTLLTLLVSYLHYAYDGMIWKGKRPAPAQAVAGGA